MRHYLFVNKELKFKSPNKFKLYGSIKAIIENEIIIIKGKKQTYGSMAWRLAPPKKTFENDDYYISQREVIRQKKI